MKNKALIAAIALAGAAALTGCEDDSKVVIQTPTEFKLNTPPMADQIYYFSCDASGKALNDIQFTVSQPDYGVGTPPTYTVQLARSEEDFKLWDEQQAAGDDTDDSENTGEDAGVEGDSEETALPLTVMCSQTFNNAYITIGGEVFCNAVNELYGFERTTYAGEVVPVAVRVHAQVGSAAYTGIWSNPVTLAGVRSYFKLVKGKLYVIGAPTGWNIDKSDIYLEETEIGSKLYRGQFEVPEGQFQFRFYSELGDWESNSYGAQKDDKPVNIAWSATEGYEGSIVAGKGSFQVPDWAGGMVSVEINLNDDVNTVKMTPAEPGTLWVIGDCMGWNINGDKNYTLTETAPGSKIYEGTISVEAGKFTFRFYTEPGSWDTGSIGAQEEDNPVEITLAGGVYTGAAVAGKGSWTNPAWAGGDLFISVDMTDEENYSVTFSKVEE